MTCFKIKTAPRPGCEQNDGKPTASIEYPFLPPSRLPKHGQYLTLKHTSTRKNRVVSVGRSDAFKHARIFRKILACLKASLRPTDTTLFFRVLVCFRVRYWPCFGRREGGRNGYSIDAVGLPSFCSHPGLGAVLILKHVMRGFYRVRRTRGAGQPPSQPPENVNTTSTISNAS